MEEEDELWDKLDTMCALKFHLQRDNCYCFSTKYGDIKYIDSRFSCKDIWLFRLEAQCD